MRLDHLHRVHTVDDLNQLRNSAMAQPCKAAMASRVGLGHLLDYFEDSRRPSSLSPRFLRVPVDGWMDHPSLGAQVGVFMPLGSLGACSTLPCTRSSLGEKELGFHKISLVQIFLIRSPFLAGTISPTSGLQIMQIWCPGCMTRNFLQLWYSFVSLETRIRCPNRPWNIICSDSGLTAQQGFRRSYLLAPLSELGLPHIQIEGIVDAHNFGSQTFAIRGNLSL
jgi:hypothetical protein